MKKDKLNVVVFSGGSGCDSLVKSLVLYPDISLTVLVNAYDDGLSTGEVRRVISGMLGPSDIRKNIVRLIPDENNKLKSLKELLDYRLPKNFTYEEGILLIKSLHSRNIDTIDKDICSLFIELTCRKYSEVVRYLVEFMNYLKENDCDFNFSDCSIGNIVLGGIFVETKCFNLATSVFQQLCEVNGTVLNITKGENLVLVGLKEDGSFFCDEAAIVSEQNKVVFRDVYLLPKYLDSEQLSTLNEMNTDDKHDFLLNLEKQPLLNEDAENTILGADLIIYGPGTQHSSLYPSYFTKGVMDAVSKNKAADKVFVSNIYKDHDIQGESVNSIIDKFFYYANEKGSRKFNPSELITSYFLQMPKNENINYLKFNEKEFKYPEKVVVCDWETGDGRHFGNYLFKELLNTVETKLSQRVKPFHHTVSIIVPCLNEAGTVSAVLKSLTHLSFNELSISKEIIFVDGGSTDKSLDEARKFKDVKVLPLEKVGRGRALREGVKNAKGDIVVFFPSDNEYRANDLLNLVKVVLDGEYDIVYGSRTTKCVSLDEVIQSVYGGNRVGYLVSKYGGILLSVFSLLKFNRYISDVLTGIKVFEKKTFESFSLISDGVELEGELVAKISRSDTYLLELPVNYSPRRKNEGKKITMIDGLKTLKEIILG